MEKCFICETQDSFAALHERDVINWQKMDGTVYIYFDQTGKSGEYFFVQGRQILSLATLLLLSA